MSVPKELRTININKNPVKNLDLTWDQPDSTFKIVSTPTRPLNDGEVLIKNLILSNDPSQRSWIQKNANAEALYTQPIRAGQPMEGLGIGQIVQSNNTKFNVGDIVTCITFWGEHVILPAENVRTIIDPKNPFPLTAYLDYLGLTGITAYIGLFEIAKLKSTDVLVVSGAAGATGAMVVQIAKNIIGAKKVIGIAGGKTKCDYVKSLGADDCVDYRDANFFVAMTKALGEDKVCDVYFDGVGGQILDQMLMLTKRHGQVIACGAVAGYNDSEKLYVRGWPLIITRRLTVKGYIVLDYLKEAQEAVMNLISYVQQGKIKVGEDSFEVIDLSKEADVLAGVPNTFNKLFTGEKKFGKLLTKIAEPKL